MTLPDGVPSTVVVERPKAGSTATTPPTWPSSWARRPGWRRATWPACWPRSSRDADGIGSVDIAGPGFLNIRVEAGAQGSVAADVVAAGAAYGSNDAFAGEKINVEFVSANPTGPLHIGGIRWAAVGDALGRVLEFSGAQVTREYYFNDHGGQIDRFSRLAAGQRPRRGRRPRTATAAPTSPRSPPTSWRSAPTPSTCPTTRRRRSSAASASS